MKSEKERVIKFCCLIFWLAVWETVSVLIGNELIFPSPMSVLSVLGKKVFDSVFWLSIFCSLGRMAAGFTLAVAAGVVLAVAESVFKPLEYLLHPLMTVIKSVPVASFIILVLLWVKSSYVPVLISFLMVLPIVTSNISQAIKETDQKLLELAKVYKFGCLKTAKFIYVPQCLPAFNTSCVLGIGFGWKAAVAAEVIANPKLSIGRGLYNGRLYLETAELFAWTVVLVELSLILEKLFKKLIHNMFRTGEKV
ncbi:MAG: ABC transporter permease subunit [Firmicutes bacterium]|nr:ABC transporter permease subunit [Bacillota bacterium]